MRTTYFKFDTGHDFELASEVVQNEEIDADEVSEAELTIVVKDIVEAEYFDLRLTDRGIGFTTVLG